MCHGIYFFQAQARDPKYKTAICEAWKSNGTCDRGSNCIYAHGQSDLRQKSQMSMPPMTNMTTAYPPQYGGKLIFNILEPVCCKKRQKKSKPRKWFEQ